MKTGVLPRVADTVEIAHDAFNDAEFGLRLPQVIRDAVRSLQMEIEVARRLAGRRR